MTETTYDAIRLTAEDFEFVVRRPYVAYHACGTAIRGLGSDMHDRMRKHTDSCDWKEPTA
jgi:hypothetical protein